MLAIRFIFKKQKETPDGKTIDLFVTVPKQTPKAALERRIKSIAASYVANILNWNPNIMVDDIMALTKMSKSDADSPNIPDIIIHI